MKKMLLICGTLLLVTATSALAQAPVGTLQLSWDGCPVDGGLRAKTDLCTVTTGLGGTKHLVLSILMTHDVALFNSTTNQVWVATAGTLPGWWGGVGACKTTAIFGLNATPASLAIGCGNDAYLGNGQPGLNTFYSPSIGLGANALAAQPVIAVAPGNETTLLTGQEYFVGDLTFNLTKGRVADACPGCLEPACINFKLCGIATSAAGSVDSQNVGGVSSWVTWQSPAAANGDAACLGATPTRNTTWGSVKALYR